MKNIIIITGASSGMGKEFAIQILEKEPNIDEIWAIARDKVRLDELKEKISNKIIPIKLDLTSKDDLIKFKEKINREQPNVIILANCAGFGKFDHSENIKTNIKLNMIDLNVKAPVALIDYTLPYMKENSKIMNIASCAGFQPIPYINDYVATKSYLLSYSRALNEELKYKKIHVLAVTPYWTKTAFFDRAIDEEKKKVVINYNAMYDPKKVMKKAIKDLYNPNKDISCYGFVNNFQKFLTKILPHKLVMKVWMNGQKLDGTPNIRK